MNIVYFLLTSNIFVVVLTVVLSLRSRRQRDKLRRQRQEISLRYYEASVLYDISSKIGYSFSIHSIAEIIVVSVEKLFSLSTISYAALENGDISIKTFQKEAVGEAYLRAVQEIILRSLRTSNPSVSVYTVHNSIESMQKSSNYVNLHFDTKPKTYFTVPLVVNNNFVGAITITSRIKHAYTEEEMSVLYKIIHQAEETVERLEQIVTAEKRKIGALMSGIPSGVMFFTSVDDSLELVTINHAAKSFLGFTEQDTVNALIVARTFSDSLQLDKQVKDAIKEKKCTIIHDVLLNGKYFQIYINPIDVQDQNRSGGATVSLQDVSLEKEVEEIRENFTSMVVHELRAPVTSIKGASSLLSDDRINNEDYRKMVKIIKGSSERMLNQINDLLDAAKLQAGKFSLTRDVADLNQLVKDRVESFQFQAADKKVNLHAETDSAVPPFIFDKFRVDQVITNLLSNALKFTPEGGEVVVRSELKNDLVEVSVKDSGIGIPKDKQALLFSQYSQIQNTLRHDGTGLGLFISRGIVDSHGGKIWVESEEGKGATMIFTLPIVKTSAETVKRIGLLHQFVN